MKDYHKKTKINKYIFFLIAILVILLLVAYKKYFLYEKNLNEQYQVNFSPLLEKYTKNKITAASEVIKDIFPDVDQSEFPIMCTMTMENPYLLNEKFQVNFIHTSGKVLESKFFQRYNLQYYPYYIFLIDRSSKKYTYKLIDFYNNNYTDADGGINNRNIEMDQSSTDKITETIKNDKSIQYEDIQVTVGNKEYTHKITGFKIPCVDIQDLQFYTYNVQKKRLGKSYILKHYGFAMKNQINNIFKGEK